MRLNDGLMVGRWLTACLACAALISAGILYIFEQNDPPNKEQPSAVEPVTIQAESSVPAKIPPTLSPARTPAPADRTPSDSPRLADERVVFHTIAGDLVLAFYPDVAPKMVQQILRLVRMGVYDTTHFGSFVPGFYLQLNNPDERLIPMSEEAEKALTPVKAEFSKLHHRRGILSMPSARSDDPDSAISSFSIFLGEAGHVDGHQTVFGHVESGMDVLDRIEQIPRINDNKPLIRLTILQAEVVSKNALTGFIRESARPLTDILAQEPLPALALRAHALLKDKCFRCHSGPKPAGKLDLTSQAGLFRGGKHGPAIYRDNALSSLLRKRVTAADKSVMPPDAHSLNITEIALLSAWIDAGGAMYPPGSGPAAPEPKESESEVVTAEDAAFWSFTPLQKTKPPGVKDSSRIKTSVDRFLLAKLEANGLTLNASAERRTLIRRLSFDLLGLPPTPEEVDAFVADTSPGAYERLVDRLLASPHFGERWGRHWLDLARYADSGGYEDDNDRPFAYTYRDFVIRAFNDDLPFDTFLRWQIAGDEIEPGNRQALAATGFVTAGPLQTFFPRKRDRYDELDDIVSTVGSAMLGLSVGCARCHDHKHDPIPQEDYYHLQAVFAGSRREEQTLSPDDGVELNRQIEYFQREAARLREVLQAPVRARKVATLLISEEDKALLRKPADPANSRQAELLKKFATMLKIEDHEMFPDPDDQKSLERLTTNLEELTTKKLPKGLTLTGGLGRTFFLNRGDPEQERDSVYPGFLTVLTRGRPVWNKHTWENWTSHSTEQSLPQPRRALANWLTDVNNGAGRLVARVIVNRLWQHHFGEGLVRTPNDFGTHGDPPSHPELLDWLAEKLIENGWHLKPIHRLIVNSETYRQDTILDTAKVRIDPENRLFGRRRPQRLSAEALRDALLVVGGNLNQEMFGPGIKPPIPAEAIFPTAPKHGTVWAADAKDGPATWRRSIYIITKRSNPVPFLQTFDAPDTAASCACRSDTTVPTQALILMNDEFVISQARRLADRVQATAGKSPANQVREAFRFALGRQPDSAEVKRAVRFLGEQSLADFCQVLLQSNEFIYID